MGYTRHLCVVCNYSYLSDFVTSGDTGYVEEEEPKPSHEHKYNLYVQNYESDKYFIAINACLCGSTNAGELNIQLVNVSGETMQLVADEFGQVDYGDIYGEWLVTIYDENGEQLTMFDLSAGAASEVPEEPDDGGEVETPEEPDDGEDVETPETPDDGEDVETPETPDDGEDVETPETPDDGEDIETPETPDDGEDVGTPENPDETVDETEEGGGSGTAIILLIVFVLFVAGGIGAVIFLKKRKNKNQN